MRCWLVTIGEPVPVTPNRGERLHRAGFLSRLLSENGHDVTWWTSTFDHFKKKHLFTNDTTVMLNERLRVNLLHGCGYKSNMSVARLVDHKLIARKFARSANRQKKAPDVILASLPTTELCLESVRYGKKNGVPVILDMRDMWPDIFIDHSPKYLRPLTQLILTPMFRSAASACSSATAITGITDAFMDWGLERGCRNRSDADRSFPFGYLAKPPDATDIEMARAYWDNLGVRENSGEFRICFFGTIGRQLGLDVLIKAVKQLRQRGKPVRAVLCGAGDFLEHYKRMAEDCSDILFPGWVNAAQINVLLRRSSVGIDPLPDRYDFHATINNKAIEYLSAGLPVVSTPDRGVLYDLLSEHQCGMSYPYGDVDALADLLHRLCDDVVTLRRMSENSSRVFEQMFTAERVYAEMMEYLIEIARTGKPLGGVTSTSDCV